MADTRFARRMKAILGSAALLSMAAMIVALCLPPPPAHACSCGFVEDWGFYGAQESRLPANAAGVAWYAPTARHEPEEHTEEILRKRFIVEIREKGTFRPLPVWVRPVKGFRGIYVVGPEGEGLKAGVIYRFTVDEADPDGGGHRQVVVTVDRESLSADTALDLDVGPVTNEFIGVAAGGSCSDGLYVSQVSIEATLAANARQWHEHLLFRTIVDDESEWHARHTLCEPVPPGRSWEEIGRDRVFAPCQETWNHYILELEPGQHALKMQAFLPGTDIVLETPVRSVRLSCS